MLPRKKKKAKEHHSSNRTNERENTSNRNDITFISIPSLINIHIISSYHQVLFIINLSIKTGKRNSLARFHNRHVILTRFPSPSSPIFSNTPPRPLTEPQKMTDGLIDG